MSKKDCMFQYAIAYRYLSNDIVEDTPLITLDEARELWHKYLPDFIRHREMGDSDPEMALWINCNDNTDYRETLVHVDNETVVENGRLYQVIKKEITV